MATNTFTNATFDGLWSTALNWSLARVPLSDDDVDLFGSVTSAASSMVCLSLTDSGGGAELYVTSNSNLTVGAGGISFPAIIVQGATFTGTCAGTLTTNINTSTAFSTSQAAKIVFSIAGDVTLLQSNLIQTNDPGDSVTLTAANFTGDGNGGILAGDGTTVVLNGGTVSQFIISANGVGTASVTLNANYVNNNNNFDLDAPPDFLRINGNVNNDEGIISGDVYINGNLTTSVNGTITDSVTITGSVNGNVLTISGSPTFDGVVDLSQNTYIISLGATPQFNGKVIMPGGSELSKGGGGGTLGIGGAPGLAIG